MPFPGTLPVALQGAQDFLGYVHPGSAMFDGTSADYLRYAGASSTWSINPTDDTTCTFSAWFRLGVISAVRRTFIIGWFNGSNLTYMEINAAGQFEHSRFISGYTTRLISNRVFIDPTAWSHLVFHWDSGNATPALRQRVWIDNEEINSWATKVDPALNADHQFTHNGWATAIGNSNLAASAWNGFLSDVHFVDGALVDPSVFGSVHPVHGEWIPKKPTGITYGATGFFLDFADSAALGDDESGNANDFVPLGAFGSANSFVDVPANTYPLLNTVWNNTGVEYKEAGLSVIETGAASQIAMGSLVLPKGKWYWEATITAVGIVAGVGVATDPEHESAVNAYPGAGTRNGVDYLSGGAVDLNGVLQYTGSTYTTADVIGIAVDNSDPTAPKVFFRKNTVWQNSGDPTTGAGAVTISPSHPYPETPSVVPFFYCSQNTDYALNFGQRRNGFTYTPPAGYSALNAQNFPTPTGPALNPKKYMGIIQVEGDGATSRTITDTDEVQFTPDLVISKNIDRAVNWRVAINMAGYSPSPATPNNLAINVTDAASDFVAGNIEGFTFGGFDVADGSTSGLAVNANGETIEAWCFKSDPAAGFEIVRATGTGVARTIPHNLGKVPRLIIAKRLDAAGAWPIYSATYGRVADPQTDYMLLNSNAAAVDNTYWNDTAPTDSVFSVGAQADVNALNGEYVYLLFTDIPGFLKVHSYEGNGNAEGVFQPTTFAPRFMYTKNWNAAANAQIWQDNLLDEADYNQRAETLNPDSTAAIGTTTNQAYDLLANGLKRRAAGAANTNANWHAGFTYAQVASKFARAR